MQSAVGVGIGPFQDGEDLSGSATQSRGRGHGAGEADGIDGIEDNAGARVAPDTLSRALSLGHKLDDHLQRNDACGFFEPLGDLVITGPTHTNVNDFRAMLVL